MRSTTMDLVKQHIVLWHASWGLARLRIVLKTMKGFRTFNLVPTCPKNRKNWGILRSSDVWDSHDQCVNTPSQTSQMVGEFYDVIGRIGSISTLKVLSQTVPDVGDECEHEISLSGTVADDRAFLR